MAKRSSMRPLRQDARPCTRVYEYDDGRSMLEAMVVKAVRPAAFAT